MGRIALIIALIMTVLITGCGEKKQQVVIFKSENTISSHQKKESGNDFTKPVKRERKQRIAVIQSDDYYEYFEAFTEIYRGFEALGWIKDTDILRKKLHNMNDTLIEDLQNYDYSDYIEFKPEYYYSFKADEKNAEDKRFKKLVEKIKNNEVDLVISLGTMATQILLSQPGYKSATLMDAITDPIGSGLVKSIQDSGQDNLTARIDTDQYLRQVKLFYDVVNFKKMGIIYENSENGRSYAAVDYVEKIAKEKNFEIIRDNGALAEPSEEELQKGYRMYLEAMDRVCPKSDAVFLGVSGGLEDANMPNVVKRLVKYKIPSFTMEGSYMVRKGAMIGVSGKEMGMYDAVKAVKILNGVKPRELSQKYEKMPKISLNLKMAELIGYDIPVDIIKSADEIYNTIEGVDASDF